MPGTLDGADIADPEGNRASLDPNAQGERPAGGQLP
jgi:hypothetical protein